MCFETLSRANGGIVDQHFEGYHFVQLVKHIRDSNYSSNSRILHIVKVFEKIV